MNVGEILRNRTTTGMSIEVLPPAKGKGIEKLYADIDLLREFNPLFINITTHHSEPVYEKSPDGSLRKMFVRKRPGTVAVAASIQHKYGIPTVPHIICHGFTRAETEYVLIDLNFLGIKDLLVLRGDMDKEIVVPAAECHEHAIDLIDQINNFNAGHFLDGDGEAPVNKFSFGVAGYPEKHAEAPNMASDIRHLKAKVDAGAEFVITQLFYDNQKYFDFVDRCRAEGINVPIIPGLKPLSRKKQLSVLPRTFCCELPEQLVKAVEAARDDAEVAEIGRQWLKQQCLDLIAHGVPCIHFYTMGAAKSIAQVAKEIF